MNLESWFPRISSMASPLQTIFYHGPIRGPKPASGILAHRTVDLPKPESTAAGLIFAGRFLFPTETGVCVSEEHGTYLRSTLQSWIAYHTLATTTG